MFFKGESLLSGEKIDLSCNEELDFDDLPNSNQNENLFHFTDNELASVMTWIDAHRQFLTASFSSSFSPWVAKNLDQNEKKALNDFSSEFKNFMEDAHHPFANDDDIQQGANVDITSYFISSIRSKNTQDLVSFLRANAKLVIFFDEEFKALDPITKKMGATKSYP